jgi:hypothetical protein
MVTSRRAFIVGGLVLGAGTALPRLSAQPSKPAITVYRDPT